MKLAKRLILLLFVLSIIKIVADNKQNLGQAYRNYKHRKEPVTLQQKSEHMITFLDKEGNVLLCVQEQQSARIVF